MDGASWLLGRLQLDALLDATVANIQARWPSIERVDLWLIVGVEHDGTCYSGSREVRATQYHRDVQRGLEDYLWRHPEIGAGPEIHVDCSGFSDWIGHLNAAGQAEAGAYLDAWYVSEPEPEPETTTTVEEPTTTVVEDATTTVEQATTTLVEEVTTTSVPEETTSTVEETTTTVVEATTTTLPACEPIEG